MEREIRIINTLLLEDAWFDCNHLLQGKGVVVTEEGEGWVMVSIANKDDLEHFNTNSKGEPKEGILLLNHDELFKNKEDGKKV